MLTGTALQREKIIHLVNSKYCLGIHTLRIVYVHVVSPEMGLALIHWGETFSEDSISASLNFPNTTGVKTTLMSRAVVVSLLYLNCIIFYHTMRYSGSLN